jgi:hypothetical protein
MSPIVWLIPDRMITEFVSEKRADSMRTRRTHEDGEDEANLERGVESASTTTNVRFQIIGAIENHVSIAIVAEDYNEEAGV